MLAEDNDTVSITAEGIMLEGTSCGTDDKDDSGAAGPTDVVFCTTGDCDSTASIHMVNGEIAGGDTIDIEVTYHNALGDVIQELPDVRPENLRKVTFSGDIELWDDEVFGHETNAFSLGEECVVDPWDRESTMSWSRCVGSEVILEVKATCTLSSDNVSVDVAVTTQPLEGDSCETDDLERTRNDELLLAPCNGNCAPGRLEFRLENGRQGDWGALELSIDNERR